MRLALPTVALLLALAAPFVPARAQFAGGPPPPVGVVQAKVRPMTESQEYVGRVQAVGKVDIVARVTAYIEKIDFVEGAEVHKGDLLYELERGPFEADLANKQAAVAQAQALLRNASITLRRAQTLLHTPAGQQSTVDDALAQQGNYAAQVEAGQAAVRASQINLDYTQIRAPIDGKITRYLVTVGNVVTPTSGVLASMYSQDPIYVLFAVPVRAVLQLRSHYAGKGGFDALEVKLLLPDGTVYGPAGKLDYVDPSVSANTDTLQLRASIPNPLRANTKPDEPASRELVDGEFVTVMLQGVAPVQALTIPRIAVLSDQLGYFVYVVGPDHKVEQRRVTLGQAADDFIAVQGGLKVGETVVVDGLQRVRPGAPVTPTPFGAAAKG